MLAETTYRSVLSYLAFVLINIACMHFGAVRSQSIAKWRKKESATSAVLGPRGSGRNESQNSFVDLSYRLWCESTDPLGDAVTTPQVRISSRVST